MLIIHKIKKIHLYMGSVGYCICIRLYSYLVDQVTSGGRFTCIDVTNDDKGNVDLLLRHDSNKSKTNLEWRECNSVINDRTVTTEKKQIIYFFGWLGKALLLILHFAPASGYEWLSIMSARSNRKKFHIFGIFGLFLEFQKRYFFPGMDFCWVDGKYLFTTMWIDRDVCLRRRTTANSSAGGATRRRES